MDIEETKRELLKIVKENNLDHLLLRPDFKGLYTREGYRQLMSWCLQEMVKYSPGRTL